MMVIKKKKSRKANILDWLIRWETILFLILILVIIINSNISPYFLDYINLMNATFNFTEKAIIALPMIFVIICGDIDISLASMIALCSVFMGLASSFGIQTWGLILIGCLTGMAAGFLKIIFRRKMN